MAIERLIRPGFTQGFDGRSKQELADKMPWNAPEICQGKRGPYVMPGARHKRAFPGGVAQLMVAVLFSGRILTRVTPAMPAGAFCDEPDLPRPRDGG
jgi:hypothetical protein